ncbi:SPASM domain-containing protein [Caloranaerobacter sp. DY30410]|uniref:SPASM domain-containing protein n=1 Tax=Caloranaerobacter sp. DY30410 TaxID=3238305 RepID=UPI003CFF491E
MHWAACVVDTDGVFGPCFNLIGTKHFKYDNFQIDDEWLTRTPLTNKDCHNCIALGVCGGICTAHSHAIGNGNLNTIHPEYSCAFTKKILDWMIWDLDSRMNNTRVRD